MVFIRGYLTEPINLRRYIHWGQPLVWRTALQQKAIQHTEPDVAGTHRSLLLCLPISCCQLLSGIDPRNLSLVLALRRFAVSCCADPVSDLPSVSPLWTPIPSAVTDYISDFSHFLSVLKWNQCFSSALLASLSADSLWRPCLPT